LQARWDLYKQGTTDDRGHFSLRGLNPGKYKAPGFPDDIRRPNFRATMPPSLCAIRHKKYPRG
jgi:hypothetical protein